MSKSMYVGSICHAKTRQEEEKKTGALKTKT